MKNSCVVTPYIQNTQGEIVESKLFKDLLEYTNNNRSLAKDIYSDSHDSALIEEHSDYMNYDENGELTLDSVLKITRVEIEDYEKLKHLNSQIPNKEFVYNEAVTHVISFNQNNPFRQDYMAILIPYDNNRFKVEVVKNTQENKDLLYNEVFNGSLQKRIIYRLAEAGVSVEFLEQAPYEGRYSTKNALKTAEGLYNLISVLNGENLNPTLLEETGHFILGALGNNPLATRLVSLMSEDLQKSVLGQDFSEKYLGSNSQRETAGVLIGEALQGIYNKHTNSNSIKNLLNRIINFSKKLFYKLSKNKLALDIMEAREIASSIAEDFLYRDFNGTVENALDTEETLFNKKTSESQRVLNNIALNFKKTAQELKGLNKKLYEQLNHLYTQAEIARTLEDAEALGDMFTTSNVAALTQKLVSILEFDVTKILSQVNTQNNTSENLVSNGADLHAVRIFVKSVGSILEILNDSMEKMVYQSELNKGITVTNNKGQQEIVSMQALVDDSFKYLQQLVNVLQRKEDSHFLNFLENTYGSKIISRGARLVFSKKYVRGEIAPNTQGLGPVKRFIESRLKRVEATNVPISDYLKYLERDCPALDKHLWTTRKNRDVIVSITKDSIQQSVRYSQRIMQDDLVKVIELEKRYKELYKQKKAPEMKDFYERFSDTGEFTGNYLEDRNYGEFERALNNFREEHFKEFLEQHPTTQQLPEAASAVLFSKWYEPKLKQWYKNNTEAIPDPKNPMMVIKVPKMSLYPNPSYIEFSRKYPEALQLLKDIKSVKQNMDTRLESGSTKPHRAPQFYGTLINKFKNNRESYSFLTSLKKTFYSAFESLSEDMSDDMFGNDLNYNDKSDMLYYNAMQYNNDQINRLTTFGIRPLKDSKKMSTDLFGTLLLYSNMSSKYFSHSLLVNTLEVGRSVLSRRKVESNIKEEDRQIQSNAFSTYCKELDLRFYKKSGSGISLSKTLIYRKVAGLLNRSGSGIYMVGNIPGAVVNIGTGNIEMFKEAVCGEFFTLNTFKKAVKIYYKYAFSSLSEWGLDYSTNKLDLFVDYFDARSENDKTFNNHHSNRHRALNILLDLGYAPYKMGEHYMQAVPYIAMALEKKLYKIVEDEQGRIKTVETTLWDAYGKSSNNMQLELQGTYLKNKNDLVQFKFLNNLYNKINTIEVQESVKNNKNQETYSFNSINLTDEEKEYIRNLNVKPSQIINAVLNKRNQLLWDSSRGSKDESDFQWKCRQVTNQMHGVYNYIDKQSAQNTFIGDLIFAMRGYALGMADRRFSGDKFDINTKEEGSGSITDTLLLILSGFTSYGSISNTLLGLFAPVVAEDYVSKRLKQMGFGDHQYKNLRRNSMDITFAVVLAILKLLTRLNEDDDDYSYILGITHYFVTRLLKEQQSFNSVRGISDEITGILGLQPIAYSAIKDMLYIASGLGGFFYEPKNKKIRSEDLPLLYTYFFYNSSKKNVYDYGDSKQWRKLRRLIPYWRTFEIFKNPYESAASFTYAKKLK